MSLPHPTSNLWPRKFQKRTTNLDLSQDLMLSRVLTSDMVDIFVGPKRKKFHLHRELLCDRSDYFNAAFQGSFAESTSNELFLPDDDDEAFEFFVNWLYGATLRINTVGQLHNYLALLVLSEKILVEHLQNLTVDLIRAYYRTTGDCVRARDVIFVNEQTGSAQLVYLMADILAQQALQEHGDGSKVKPLTKDLEKLILAGGALARSVVYYMMPYFGQSPETRVRERLAVGVSCFYHRHIATPVFEETQLMKKSKAVTARPFS